MTQPEPFRRQPRTAPPPVSPGTEESERLAQLRDMLANLTDFIEKEAEKLAGPLIEDAAERARAMVAIAGREAQRWQDANTELGRRLEAHQRFADENRDACRRLAAALGPQHAGRLLPDLVTAAVAEILEARKQREQGNA